MDEVKIYEVGARDGLQNESAVLSTQTKISFISLLAESGLKYIEAGAFVSPKWVPQMAGTAEIYAGLERKDGVVYAALVPNMRGMEEAMACDVREIAIFTAASQAFTKKNINCTIEESLERFLPVIEAAKLKGISVRGYVSCIAGCPYAGEVEAEDVASVSGTLFEMGCYEISLGDTIGVGYPEQIKTVLDAVRRDVPIGSVALHCHATHGRALQNIEAGLEEGVRVIDSSAGGLGGCPYAEGASGNVASEEVLALLDDLGYTHGIDLEKVKSASAFIKDSIAAQRN